MSYYDDVSRFDDEGGAMMPTTAYAHEQPSPLIGFIAVAVSGALVAFLLTWIF